MLLYFLLLAVIVLSDKNPEESWTEKSLSDYYDELQETCSATQCKEYNRYESMNCIHQCISARCYDLIYKDEPLEPGEIDEEREDNFISCAKEDIVSGRISHVSYKHFTNFWISSKDMTIELNFPISLRAQRYVRLFAHFSQPLQ